MRLMLAATDTITSVAGTSRSIVRHVVLSVETTRPTDFVDLTGAITATIQGFAFRDGIVTIQTRHTTTGILVNELEPLLLEDLAAMFEHVAPAVHAYAHDDFARRSVNLMPNERPNGHAHCRAALLRASESVVVSQGALALGRWQRILFVELDGAQRREISVMLMGEARR
jgi:secondary thiamine-phosphate synthase enzyme